MATNLRSMGVNRSLVLVDGKRWVSGGARTSAVDLNSIPDAMIDRIEIVTGGAAAIYGADAVTGAVNILMKKNMTGLHLSAANGISQKGDGQQTNVSAATGFKFAEGRGAFEIGGTYNRTTPLGYVERYKNRIGFVPNPASTGPHDGIPDNVLDDDMRYLHRPSVPTIFYDDQWYSLNDGLLSRTGYDYAFTPNALSGGHGGTGGTGFENHLLRNKLVLASLYSRLSYELGPITWNTTFAYAHTYARAPSVFSEVRDDLRSTNWWGGTTGEIATLANPNLPESLRQFMIANGVASVPLNRTYTNLPRPFEIHQRNYITAGTDFSGGLTGKLKWSAFFQYGRMTDEVTTTNMIRHTRWLSARDVVLDPATGWPACADLTARTAGCVPFDIFTTDAPGQAFLEYVEADRHERRSNRLYSGGSAIQGGIFALPYGEVSIAAGLELRRETLSTQDDADTVKLNDIVFKPGVDYVLHPALDARRDTAELYGEVALPVLRGLPFARHLEMEGAYRFSHYSDEPSTSTWKLGGTWEPFKGLAFRGVHSHSVRIPNFGELYSPQLVQTVGITNDPCSGSFINQGPNRARNCAALLPGLSLPLQYPNTNAPTIYLGGNSKLTPETSNSFTSASAADSLIPNARRKSWTMR
jgi:outer membrane receptor protein involved in Fe transport